MSDLCAQRMDDLIEGGIQQMNEYEKRIDELEADHVSKSELRAWCEKNIDNFSTNNYKLGWDGALLAILEKFCTEEK